MTFPSILAIQQGFSLLISLRVLVGVRAKQEKKRSFLSLFLRWLVPFGLFDDFCTFSQLSIDPIAHCGSKVQMQGWTLKMV